MKSSRLRGPRGRMLRTTVIATLVLGAAGTAVTASVPGAARPTASSTDATAQEPAVFIAVSPVRVLDTRGPAAGGPIGVPTSGKIGPDSQITLTLAGPNLYMPIEATAALLNVTIDGDASLPSFLTVWPSNEARPFTSANNALPGLIASNSMLAKLGNGAISIYNQQGEVNVVMDLVGYMVPLSTVEGVSGNNILSGEGAPADTLGEDGDFYIDVINNALYGPKTDGEWPVPPIQLGGGGGPAGPSGSPGPAGPAGADGSKITTGTTVPSDADGEDGDLYINTTTGILYTKNGGTWVSQGSIQGPAGADGADGADGSKILTGAGAPSPAIGVPGDVYINLTNGDLYTKTIAGWGTPSGSIQGPAGDDGADGADGSQILTGAGAPSPAIGVPGDVYINLTNGDLYTKTIAGWGTPSGSIQGPQGVQGPAGPPGTVNGTFNGTNSAATNPVALLDTTGWNTVATFTVPALGSYLLQANIGTAFENGGLLAVGAASTTTCRWANNPNLQFGASMTAGITVLAIGVPGIDEASIGVPGYVTNAAAGTTVDLECEVDTLLAVNNRTEVTAAFTAMQVTNLTVVP